LILLGGTVEAAMKVAALLDLRHRAPDDVRGSRKWWALGVVLINAGGLVPAAYFAFGRRPKRRRLAG